MSSGDSSSESVRAAGQPMRGKADREERVSHGNLRRETLQPQRAQEMGRDSQAASKHVKEGEGRRCPKTWGHRLSPAVASSSSVAASSFHFSSATFSRRASSFLMYSSNSCSWKRKSCLLGLSGVTQGRSPKGALSSVLCLVPSPA